MSTGAPDEAAPVAAAVAAVRGRIAAAAGRAGRDPAEVRLVGASKGVPASRIAAAVRAGVVELGENRAQELTAKAPHVAAEGLEVVWHFIGTLQRNKVRPLTPWVALWHTVDRPALGDTLAREAPGAAVLVEVNVAREAQKAGCDPADAPGLVDALRGLGLAVEGLMCVPPAGADARPWFARLRELAAELGLRELSMGMSDDFETAVEEGATIVRVGRALFGARVR